MKPIRTTNDRTCEYCKKNIVSPTNRQKYHMNCSKEVRRQKMKDYNIIYREKTKEPRKQILRNNRIRDYHKHKKKRLKTSKKWHEKNKNRVREYNQNKNFERSIVRETHRRFKKESRCGLCNGKDNLEIHHFRYISPVQRKHITTLCKKCHSIIHRKVRLQI